MSYFHLEVAEAGSNSDLVCLPQLGALGDALHDAVDVGIERRVEALCRQVFFAFEARPEATPKPIHFARSGSFKAFKILQTKQKIGHVCN